ncbi:MAG: type IV pilin protein [Colwellia sp.]|nr:type IV pilin protein [Colwellia sp.]
MQRTEKNLGFSLIELLITVAIVGILAGVAYPSYTDFVTRSNRAEAQRELMRLANLQEQVFVDTRSYAANMTGLGFANATYTTETGNYAITVSAQTATTFTLTATAKSSQATNDSACSTITINDAGKQSGASSHCWEK